MLNRLMDPVVNALERSLLRFYPAQLRRYEKSLTWSIKAIAGYEQRQRTNGPLYRLIKRDIPVYMQRIAEIELHLRDLQDKYAAR